MRCCVCGSRKGVQFCDDCQHSFCEWHRTFWGTWERGAAYVKEALFNDPPAFCDGHEAQDAVA